MMVIYKITNLINNMVYIGQTVDTARRRFIQHRSELRRNIHNNKHLQNAWNKYGENNFSIETIEIIDSIDDLDIREAYWINFYQSVNNKMGYNKITGGNSNKRFTEEVKQKMRGRVVSEKNRKQISERAKLRKGDKNPFYGKKHSKETKKKLSEFRKKRVRCITTGVIYGCAKDAAIANNISQALVTHCCNGRAKHAKGLVFEYILGLK